MGIVQVWAEPSQVLLALDCAALRGPHGPAKRWFPARRA